MAWRSVRTVTSAARLDAVNDLLEACGALSVAWSADGEAAVLEPAPGETPLWPRVCVDALFDLAADTAALRSALEGRFAAWGEPAPCIATRVVDDADWSSTWRAFAAPIAFGDRLTVVPRDWREPVSGAVLRLDPGLAFGTGAHATTALCLEWLARRDLAGRSIVDYGCGSGILAIAAVLLGAERAIAVDHDPQARRAARENAEFNGIDAARLRVLEPESCESAPHDVVVANILADALVALAPRFAALVRRGGALVLSGLREDQVERVVAAQPMFSFPSAWRARGESARAVRDGWVAIAGTKR